MNSQRFVLIVGLTVGPAWSFLLLKFPIQTYRALTFGRMPSPGMQRLGRVIGYVTLGFVVLLLVELAVGLVSFR